MKTSYLKSSGHFAFKCLCTGDPYYGAVDFLNVLKNGCWWGGGLLLVHSEIYYVPIVDGWEEVLVRNVLHVLHHVPVLLQV
jgi:hypothetical protein